MPVSHAPRRRALVVLAAALAGGTGCEHLPIADPSTAHPTRQLRVELPRMGVARHRSVDLWLARPRGAARKPLIVHLTGDSGRHGLDLLLFAEMTRLGYPVALISSPALAASFPDGEANSEGLSRDLDVASRAAARELLLAEDVPFLLLGQSRGAGLAVEAAVEPSLRRRLSGVVALGLCEDEVVVRDHGGWARPYRDRARLGDLPLEVIQSTHDRFFPADAARAAFGPDAPGQRLHAIQARSHTFVGNRGALLEQLAASLERVAR